MQTNKKLTATIAAIAASTIYGLSFMSTRLSLRETSPTMLLGVRFLLAFLCMNIVIALSGSRLHLKGKPVGRFLLLGLCQPVLYFIAETEGVRLTTSSFSGIMISLIPVVTAVFAAIFLKQKLSLQKILWILCSVIGVFIISSAQRESGAVKAEGILCLLGAVFAAAVFGIVSISLADAFSSIERTYIMMLMGCVVFTGRALLTEGTAFGTQFLQVATNPRAILPILYLSVLSSVVAFFCQNYSITYLGATRAATFSNITPVVSVIAGVLILHEPFSALYILGIVLILLGVYMVNRD
ncbi:MAG: DMT family transporter [Lachnospiraceae bacterium]|nr:DMT family transporter [Lachnospiraceae bacterium]